MEKELATYIVLFSWFMATSAFLIWGSIKYYRKAKRIGKIIDRLNNRENGNDTGIKIEDS